MTRWEIDPDRSEVCIDGTSSVHPIKASATGVTGWVELALQGDVVAPEHGFDGEVRISVELLRSGNSLVDRETRRRIDAQRFPEIVGTVTNAKAQTKDRLRIEGRIAFRGETCDVSGEVTVSVGDNRLIFEGEQGFDVREWGLQPPRVALLRVHPEVRVRIHVEAVLAVD